MFCRPRGWEAKLSDKNDAAKTAFSPWIFSLSRSFRECSNLFRRSCLVQLTFFFFSGPQPQCHLGNQPSVQASWLPRLGPRNLFSYLPWNLGCRPQSGVRAFLVCLIWKLKKTHRIPLCFSRAALFHLELVKLAGGLFNKVIDKQVSERNTLSWPMIVNAVIRMVD